MCHQPAKTKPKTAVQDAKNGSFGYFLTRSSLNVAVRENQIIKILAK